MLHVIVEPGFWTNEPVRVALVVGLFVALASAVVGVGVVARAQSFAGHALSDVATAGGAGASVVGASAVGGFLAGAYVGAGAIEAVGEGRLRERDLATGIVLGAATGAAALFFYLAATRGASAATAQEILFGSIFTVAISNVVVVAIGSLVVVALAAMLARPLALMAIDAQLAAARGVRVARINLVFIALVASVVAMTSIVVGSVLSTALLIGPAAAALRLARTLTGAVVVATLAAVAATWLGVLISYDSYDWSGDGRAVPVSACIVGVVIAFYALSAVTSRLRSR